MCYLMTLEKIQKQLAPLFAQQTQKSGKFETKIRCSFKKSTQFSAFFKDPCGNKK